MAQYTATDPENGTITWDLSGDDESLFDIPGGALRFLSPPDFESAADKDTNNEYQVTIEARDDTNVPKSLLVTVTVTDVNEPPAFPSDEDGARSVPENTAAGEPIGAPVAAVDPDAGASLTYALDDGTDAASFDIDTLTGQIEAKSSLDFESGTRTYTVTVSVTDGKDATGASDSAEDGTIDITITVTDANDAPTFNSGLTTTFEVDENTVAGTDFGHELTATDQDTSDTLTYSLDASSAAVFDIDSSGRLKTKAPLDHETKASYTVTILVSDGKAADGSSDTAQDARITVTVNVTDLTEDGTITLSSRQPQVGTAFTATLSDPDIGSPEVTWAWEKSSDEATWTVIASATGEAYTPLTGDVASRLKVTARYNDGQEGSADKSAQAASEFPVRAAPTGPNALPDFTYADPTSRSIVEGTQADRNIGNPVSATDADTDDADKLTYGLSGTDAESFDIDIASGQLKTKDALDYDTKRAYGVTVRVVDPSLGSDSIAVNINVTRYVPPRRNRGGSSSNTPTNSKPAFDESGPVQRSVAENTEPGVAIGEPVTATDADDTQLAYAIQAGSDGASFDIDSSSGQLKTKVSLDHEVKVTYSVTLTVTDGKNASGNPDTAADDTVTVSITVTDANDAPVFAAETATRDVAENTASGHNIGAAFTASDQDAGDTLTYTLDETSATVFDIDSKGQMKTKASLDYETKSSYSVILSLTDGKDASSNPDTAADDTVTVSITVTDANDAPAFAAETAIREVAENTASGQNIGDAFTATDQDAGDTLTYTLDEASATVFDIDSSSGQLKTKASLDYETKASFSVTISVRDSRDAEGNADTVADDTITVTVNVAAVHAVNPPIPQVNNKGRSAGGGGGGTYIKSVPTNPEPEFDQQGPVQLSIPENTEPGTAIGDPITATDADDEELVYSIQQGQDGAHFDIDSSNGQLKTKGSLDYETRTQYELRMKVQDDDGGTDRISVRIRVTGVPEPPALTGDTEVEVAENTTGRLAEYTASDPEGQTVTWGLTGDDAGDFSMASGALSFRAAPDYDAPADSDGDNVYDVTVEASDGTDSSTLDVTVTVTNLVDDFRVRGSTRGSATESDAGSDGLGIAMTSLSYPENGTVAVATYASIEPAGEQVEWSVAGDDGDLFSIDDGTLSFNDSPDYESPADSDEDNAYVVAVEASDGTETAALDVTVKVTDVNEGPTVAGDSAVEYVEQGTGSVATYTADDPEGDDLHWSLSGDDADAFSIEEGMLSFSSAPNFEEPSDSGTDNIYEVSVEVSDGSYSDSTDVSVTVTDIQEVPITSLATQAVGIVTTGSGTTIKTPDNVASATFRAGSRAKTYMARVDSDMTNCSAAAIDDEGPDPNDDDLRVCLTVAIFDTWGNEEQEVTLDQAASIALMFDAEDLGGVDLVEEAYDEGGINVYVRTSDGWSIAEFTLTTDDEGLVTITATGITQFSTFAAATDADVFNQLMAPQPTPTPAPTPTPTPQQQQTGSGPVSMMSGTGIIRMPPRPPSAPMAVPAPSTGSVPPDAPSVAQAASVEPVLPELVEKARWWALIVLIMGSVMFAAGTGMVAYPRLTAPPAWMRVPGAPVKAVKSQTAVKSRV